MTRGMLALAASALVLTFTDYLSLYRFPEGWRIVSKTFQAHK